MFDRELTKGTSFRKGGVDPAEINNMIKAGYSALGREAKVRVKESFAPSSIGYGNATCPRYWYLAFEGKYVFDESGTDHMALANMDNGNEVHKRLAKVFEASGQLVSSESELIMSDPPVRGYIDAIIRVGEEKVVVEVKSIKQEMFVMRANNMKAAPYHMYQILLYLKGANKKHGAIVYENKNDQSLLVIPVTMDEHNETIIEAALEWMRKVRKNWEDSTEENDNLPTRPWTRRNKNCKGCPLFDECWNNLPDGNVTIEPMEVATF